MNWRLLSVAPDCTHHVDSHGCSVYCERFDRVLKFHAPGLAPVRSGNEAWHITPEGAPAYDRRFKRTFGFYESRAAVAGTDGWYHIEPDGRDLYPERYAWCGNFQESRATVRAFSGAYFHISADGQPLSSHQWGYAGDYRDAVAVVQAGDGRSTHINHNGELLHGNWFMDLDVFHKGLARARDGGGWTHVSLRGVPLYGRRFAAVEPFYNGQARVERWDGGLEIIDESGARVIELRPALRSEFAALSCDMVGFWRTQTIAAAVRLGVIEALPADASRVAERCRLRADGARRILRALGELHLVEEDQERWQLTPRGQFLLAGHPMTLADAALEYADALSKMWKDLPEALRAESTWSPCDIFAEVARQEHRRKGHHRMVQSYARHDYAKVPEVLGLRGNERLIDAGGGLGVLASLLCERHPELQITILERPEVIEQARQDGPLPPNARWHPVDIFEPWQMEADVVLLSRVLHDWDDASAKRILSHARDALPTGGRLFVIEMLLSDQQVDGALCDLHLLMATGGQERSAGEFERLLLDSGFQLREVRRLPALPSILVGIAT